MPKISIIIPTLNSIGFIKSCLDSVFDQDYQDFEVIIVDNGSKDNTVSFIRENYPQVILIENKENLGACKAKNQGIEVSRGKWVLALDCDVILEKDFLNKIVRFIEESESSTGMFQPKILKDDKKTIYSCGIYLSKLMRFYDIGKGKISNGQFNIPKYIFGACSAATLYRKKALLSIQEKTGFFDERFFFLAEDVDVAWRMGQKGWKAVFVQSAVCYHTGNSSEFSRQKRQYLCWRNRMMFMAKHKIKKRLGMVCYDALRFVWLMLTNPLFRSQFGQKKI